ncbi:hypothetical protein AC229_0714 [Oenococcus oeni]|nr:hypothetical protein AC229_0714 [Oenococcus oeni]
MLGSITKRFFVPSFMNPNGISINICISASFVWLLIKLILLNIQISFQKAENQI